MLLPPDLRKLYDEIPILTIATTAILLYLSFLASYVLLAIKFGNKIILKFNLYWDKNKEPYCPICKSPLSDETGFKTQEGTDTTQFNCLKCNPKSYPAYYICPKHNGLYISSKYAKKHL